MSYGAGRQETLRYHREFYRDVELFAPGSWLVRPASYIMGYGHGTNLSTDSGFC